MGRVSVGVRHGKVAGEHCTDCGAAAEGTEGKIDRFERTIAIEGDVDAALRDKLIEIAEQGARCTKCWKRRRLSSPGSLPVLQWSRCRRRAEAADGGTARVEPVASIIRGVVGGALVNVSSAPANVFRISSRPSSL